MKNAINGVHAEIETILKKNPNKMLTRQELADFLEKLKDAIHCGDEQDKGKIVLNEEMSVLCRVVFGDNMKKGVLHSEILDKYYDK